MKTKGLRIIMAFPIFVLVIVIASAQANPKTSTTCSISMKDDLLDKTPVLFHVGKNVTGIIYPENSEERINLGKSESIKLGCPGGDIAIDRVKLAETAVISCVGDNKYSIKSVGLKEKKKEQSIMTTKYTFGDFKCLGSMKTINVRNPEKKCINGIGELREINIGLGNEEMYPLMDYCYNSSFTVWAHIKKRPWNTVPRRTRSGALWRNEMITRHLNYKDIYKIESQKESFHDILKLPQNPINVETGMFLSRGHLVPRSDMHYPSIQNVMYDYVNVVPQWESINNGNWKIVEQTIRKLADALGHELDVWTGGLGSLQMKNKFDRMRNVYLRAAGKGPGSRAVPIPKYLFKAVHDSYKNRGFVIMTINNPLLEEANVESSINCKNVCDKISIMRESLGGLRTNITKGYTYCCRIEDFVKNYPTILEQNFQKTALLEM